MKNFLIRIWNKLFSKEKPNHVLPFDPRADQLHQNDDLNTLLKEAIGIEKGTKRRCNNTVTIYQTKCNV